MPNPNQLSPDKSETKHTEWDDLGDDVELTPISVPTDEVSKISLSESPMGEDREDKRVDVEDASGTEKRTSNLMLGYNENGVQIGETYLSLEELREAALKSLEEEADDKVLYIVRRDTGKRFAEPREAVEDMLAAIKGAGPEVTLSDSTSIPNQDARSAEFKGPNGESQRGVLMLGNDEVQLPNGTYAEARTVESVVSNYAKASRKEKPEPPTDDIPPIDQAPPTEHTPPTEQTPPSRENGQDDSETEEESEKGQDDSETEKAPRKDLHQATLDLAELYARNRRLIAGPGNREAFESAKKEYQQLLAEHLDGVGRAEYEAGLKAISAEIQAMADRLAAENLQELTSFAGGDLEHPTKSPEEIAVKREELRRAAEAKMREAYPAMVERLESAVIAKMIEAYAKARIELEEATIDALDNGTLCRKAVSKIINSKWAKRGLAAATAAGLAVAAVGIGHGVADGSMAVSLSYTAGGIAAGAARGGLAGAVMSRQDSRTSAIRGYGDHVAEDLRERAEAGEDFTTDKLAEEAMSDYTVANQSDRRSNRTKTAISTGIGAAIGAAASGIHVDDVIKETKLEPTQTGTETKVVQTGTATERVQTGTTPERYDVDLSKIDVRKGSGMREAFTDLGGKPSDAAEAIELSRSFDSQHSMVPGSNGTVPGAEGKIGGYAHVYPGKVETWPEPAQEYIEQVAQVWAKEGLIEAAKIGGEPIYTIVERPIYETVRIPVISTIEKTILHRIPNNFYNALVQAEAAAASGVAGSTRKQEQQ